MATKGETNGPSRSRIRFVFVPVHSWLEFLFLKSMEARLSDTQLLSQPVGHLFFVIRRDRFPSGHSVDAVRDRDQIAGHAGGLEFRLKLRRPVVQDTHISRAMHQ